MNLFTAIANLHSDVAKIAYKDLGSAASVHCVIGVRNHLAKFRAGTVDEQGNPIETDFFGNDNDGDKNRGDEYENQMLTDGGNPPGMAPLKRAQFLQSIRLDCVSELKALGVVPPQRVDKESKADYMVRVERFKKWNWPQNPSDTLRFFSSGDGKIQAKTTSSFNRLVDKKILTRDQADDAIRKNKLAVAKQWSDVAEDILVEINSFDESKNGEGIIAFDNLEPWMGMKLYEDTIKRLRGSCTRFIASVALGNQTRNDIPPEEAEALHFLFEKEQEKLVQFQREFYKLHESAIEANAMAQAA